MTSKKLETIVIVILLSSEEEDNLNAKYKVEEKLQNWYPSKGDDIK